MIPVTVCAKNEAATLGACLDSLLAAVAFAEARLPVTFEVQVVLDDCTDGSEAIARARPVRVVRSSGGKIAAQRRGAGSGAPFVMFSDADIIIGREAILALAGRLLADPSVEVVCAAKRPVPPRRATWLAQAIHLYNARGGYASARPWFAGPLFAIRRWEIPDTAAVAARAAGRRDDRFYRLADGLLADDVYLSRVFAARPGAIAVAGAVWFRAPETLRGMYRYYRRLRRELERVELLFPDLPRVAPRRTDPALLAAAPLGERARFALFRAAVAACRIAYRADRAYHRHLARAPRDPWVPIVETKQSFDGFVPPE